MLHGSGTLLTAGTIIEADKPILGHLKPFTLKQIEEMVRSGYVVAHNKAEVIDPSQFTPTPPGLDKTPALPVDTTDDRHSTPPDKIVVTTSGGVQSSSYTAPPEEIAKSDPSPWTIDPATIEGMDLDQLNVMVKERDESVSLFADEEEARAFLSQDYDSK